MTLGEIIKGAQKTAGDEVGAENADHLWGLDEWADYANKAVNQLCEEYLLITDSSTTAICSILIPANTRIALYDPRILQMEEVRHSAQRLPLTPGSVTEFSHRDPEWRTSIGVPDSWAIDETTGYISLNKVYDTDSVLSLAVKRSPLVDLTEKDLTAVPEIRPQYHRYLKSFMLSEAYTKQDIPETIDPQKAATHLAKWEHDKVLFIQMAENRLKKGTRGVYRGYFTNMRRGR
jgi:hypothetical protein